MKVSLSALLLLAVLLSACAGGRAQPAPGYDRGYSPGLAGGGG